MELSDDAFAEVMGIVKSLDKRVKKLRAADTCPSTYDLLSLGKLNTILDEAYKQYQEMINFQIESFTEF